MIMCRSRYDKTNLHADLETLRRWNAAVEKVGVESIRARLLQSDAGSGELISIGGEDIKKGFAEQWLGWKEKQNSKRATVLMIAAIITAIATATTASFTVFGGKLPFKAF